VSAKHALRAQVRLYDRLYREPQPDAGGRDHLQSLNPDSLRTIEAMLEPTLATAAPEDRFQFERHGYFVADRTDSKPGAPVFNRAVALKDSWASGARG
jgi:glutaminyl-tRNA synthetase